MELDRLTTSVLLDMIRITLATIALVYMVVQRKPYYLFAIVCLAGILLLPISRITHIFGMPSNPLWNTPAWQFLVAPALYLYVRQILNKGVKNNWVILLHFLPFLIIYMAPLLIPPPKVPINPPMLNDFPQAANGLPQLPPPRFIFFPITHPLLVGGYLMAIWQLIQNHLKQVTNFYTYADQSNNLKWVKWLIISFISLFLFVRVLRRIGLEINGVDLPHFFVPLIFLLLTTFICYFLIKQPMLYEENWLEVSNPIVQKERIKEIKAVDTENKEEINTPTKERPTLSDLDLLLIEKLERYMEIERPYFQTKLRIAELAIALETTSHQLSKLINDHYGYNFFHFINRYRVEHAAELFKDPNFENYTIEGIGNSAGFHSRVTFNIRFKEIKGLSPKDFRKRYALHKNGK